MVRGRSKPRLNIDLTFSHQLSLTDASKLSLKGCYTLTVLCSPWLPLCLISLINLKGSANCSLSSHSFCHMILAVPNRLHGKVPGQAGPKSSLAGH